MAEGTRPIPYVPWPLVVMVREAVAEVGPWSLAVKANGTVAISVLFEGNWHTIIIQEGLPG